LISHLPALPASCDVNSCHASSLTLLLFCLQKSFILGDFYAPLARISYGDSVRPSVRPSIRPSRPGTDSMSGEIETPGLHRMIDLSI